MKRFRFSDEPYWSVGQRVAVLYRDRQVNQAVSTGGSREGLINSYFQVC